MPSQLKLLSLHKLRFVASRQPVDTFYRASDLTIGHFEALAFVPPNQLAQCRLIIADAYKSVLEIIREFGDQDTIDDTVLKMMEKVMGVIKDIEQHAAIDERFENGLESLRKIVQERPRGDGANNTIINRGTAYGQNAGNGAHFNYSNLQVPVPKAMGDNKA
ncbi:hypothetical protein JOM56_015450 [Amanita muscaria]|uniref:Uncharacterized protein n=1 Tax=Amanita muscaria (strain Koide BX008) TaxID=946122 RepID=A0A0C2X5Y8_AMAMK|nr:hypothetical protein M378DRAFT_162809 [Amanita muscaria Koide BX008]